MPSGIYVRTGIARKNMSLARIGKKLSKETIQKMMGRVSGMKGKKHTEESRELNRKKHLGKTAWNKGKEFPQVSGERNKNWKGGISKINKTERQLAMQTLEYKHWRNYVFKRDNYTCVSCHKRGIKIEADHIKPWRDYPELRYDINNGRTLCKTCHLKIGWSLFKNNNPKRKND